MLTKIVKIFVILVALHTFSSDAHAQDTFDISARVSYEISETGITAVSHEIVLQNLESEIYAPSFRLLLDNIEPENVVAYDNDGKLNFILEETESGSEIVVQFDDALVGVQKSRTFNIDFQESSFAKRSGEVWEISIPKLGKLESFDSYILELKIPKSIGEEAYISPQPSFSYDTETIYVYEYNKEQLDKTGITAGYGGVQIFSFSLSYHLENPINKPAVTTIAVPPDTSTQRVTYSDFVPEPDKITLDTDGNWLAEYYLEPRERLDVTVRGSVEVFSVPKPILSATSNSLAHNLKSTKYWPVDNPVIKEIADRFASPREIYDYVINTLTYDYGRVRPNIDRFGALDALEYPNQAICMEYTDLFISLSRAAGIPAREVNGYAYTENPEIEPLSLVADVLHSWPEYWDDEQKVWVPIDPTWGDTTGGVDYFEKLDLRHVAFVIHGVDDTIPYPAGSYKLGTNPQKDVYVNFGQAPEKKDNDIKINSEMSPIMPFGPRKARILITNYGPRSEYNFPVQVKNENSVYETKYVEMLPPFGTFEFETVLPYTFWGTNMPNYVTISAKHLSVNLMTNKSLQIIINLIILVVLLIVLVLGVLYKLGKLKLPHKD